MTVLCYLRFSLADDADPQDFEGDMRAMAELASRQPGHIWSEMGLSMDDSSVYVVVSEWDDIDDVRRWEHEAVHVQIQHKWERRFHDSLLHRRFSPWERASQA